MEKYSGCMCFTYLKIQTEYWNAFFEEYLYDSRCVYSPEGAQNYNNLQESIHQGETKAYSS